MNTNSGNDPMLSSDWGKFTVMSFATVSPAPSLVTTFSSCPGFIMSVDDLLSPEPNSALSDAAAMWSNERQRVRSIKIDDDNTFSASPYTPSGEMDSSIDMEEIDIGSNTTVTEIKSEIEDCEYGDTFVANVSLDRDGCNGDIKTAVVDISLSRHDSKRVINKFQMTEADARRLVEERFEKIAFVPSSKLNQREKIQFILAKSDCTEFSVENVLNFDKRSPDSARACAKIVQNIPQRYRWECVMPEDISCCYTIVADCKKVSGRDKPPRPMNAFMIWAQGARRLINELCPKMQNALISEALGYYWRQKSDAFKQNFEQEKIKLRRFHNVEFPEYKYKPKSKVQKAKEKQELTINKAKMRACVKREKLHVTDESTLCHRRIKCGRPRKTKVVSCMKAMNSLSTSDVVISEQLTETSFTKPAIKDMLTLKILGDRRLKGANKTLSDSKISAHSAFGQLSPLETGSPYVSAIFDDLGNFDMTCVSIDKDNCDKLIPSSVYDTPANTPPVEADDELGLSPLQPQLAALPSSSSSPTTSKESALYNSSSLSINTADNKILTQSPDNNVSMLSPSTTQISPTKTSFSVRNDQRLSSLGDLLNKSTSVSTNMQPLAVTINKVSEFSDLLFTYVTEALSAAPMKLKHIHTSSNMDINCHSDDNNNTIDTPLSYATSVVNLKAVNCFNEFSDLDTLRLDLSCPILSDDDMKSLLNTL